MTRTRLIATGSYVPEQIVSNADMTARTGLSSSAILRRTGIAERRVAAPEEASSDLGSRAAEAALAAAGVGAESLDLILVSTTSPDMFFPSTACLIQRNIGAPNAAAFDIAASCSGFLFALAVADQYLQAGNARRILVVAAEVKSRFLDARDASTTILFGDGAGAVLLEPSEEERGILATAIHSDGEGKDLLKTPIRPDRPTVLSMDGGKLYRVSIRKFTEAVSEAIASGPFSLDEIDHFIFHQANRRILRTIAKRLGIPDHKIPITLDRFGNTSSASVPITLDVLNRSGKLHPGQAVLLCAFGGGLTWGYTLIRW